MRFRHERIDDDPPGGRFGFCLTTDLTGNGLPDVVVGATGSKRPVSVLGKELYLRKLPVVGEALKRMETNVFWYENPGWERHEVANAPNLDVGAALGDLTGNGRQDLVSGQGLHHRNLYWFEQPSDPRRKWTRRVITDEFEKYHDVAVDDVDDDGELEVIALSQESAVVFYYDVPEDPTVEPWPEENRHVVAEDTSVEGALVLDVDGDGASELVAGPNVFRRDGDGWTREEFAPGWEWTRVAAGDLDGDGAPEVVLSEGDRPYHDGKPGRVGWFDGPDWTQNLLGDDLYCPHSLQVADFDGDGAQDIYVGEMGLGGNDDPKQYVYRNLGDGSFERELVASGVPTHEAKAVDMTGDGRPDIVGKSYAPTSHVDIWYNEFDG